MQQVADWLEKLGLGQYAQRFAENHINFSILPDLTDQDLEKIGVSSLGHRRQLLRAIAELNGVEQGTAKPATAAASPVAPHDTAERRQVTVMFTDLVGSSALSTRLDAEDLRTVIGAYHKCVAETVVRFGGFVAKYMGDGVLIYFGYPQAHEDDAERAVRAGLALIEAVGKLSSVEPIQVRIGVGTGVVVVGDLVGSGDAQERGVVGETPNVAARLQAAATPGTIAIDITTRGLLGGLFEYRDLGGIEAKGFANRVQAYEVVRASMVESRFEALRTATTPLIGRDEEVDLLIVHKLNCAKPQHNAAATIRITTTCGLGIEKRPQWCPSDHQSANQRGWRRSIQSRNRVRSNRSEGKSSDSKIAPSGSIHSPSSGRKLRSPPAISRTPAGILSQINDGCRNQRTLERRNRGSRSISRSSRLSPTIGSCLRSKGSLGCKVAPDIGEHVLIGMTTSTHRAKRPVSIWRTAPSTRVAAGGELSARRGEFFDLQRQRAPRSGSRPTPRTGPPADEGSPRSPPRRIYPQAVARGYRRLRQHPAVRSWG